MDRLEMIERLEKVNDLDIRSEVNCLKMKAAVVQVLEGLKAEPKAREELVSLLNTRLGAILRKVDA